MTLIMTVRNESRSIRAVLESIQAQTRPPDEVVVVDGGSQDDTVAILRSYTDRLPLVVIEQPGCNISTGRNHAIRAASGAIIAVTDAGVHLPADWLEKLTAPLAADPNLRVVSGFFHADPHTPFEVAMGATALPLAHEIKPGAFLPSSRSVAFYKSAWEAVGGYPEWLDFCEDLIFDLNLKAQFAPFGWAPEAVVAFRPRGSLRAFWKQYYHYARGDGKADLWRKRHAARYLTYLVVIPLIALLCLLGGWWWAGLYLIGGVIYLRAPYRRLPTVWTWYEHPPTLRERLVTLLWIPVIRIVGDVAKMIGYPVGWAWRLRHAPPNWRR